jgi:hypothetical protein
MKADRTAAAYTLIKTCKFDILARMPDQSAEADRRITQVDLEQGSSARACRGRVICARKNPKAAPAVHTGCIRSRRISPSLGCSIDDGVACIEHAVGLLLIGD